MVPVFFRLCESCFFGLSGKESVALVSFVFYDIPEKLFAKEKRYINEEHMRDGVIINEV